MAKRDAPSNDNDLHIEPGEWELLKGLLLELSEESDIVQSPFNLHPTDVHRRVNAAFILNIFSHGLKQTVPREWRPMLTQLRDPEYRAYRHYAIKFQTIEQGWKIRKRDPPPPTEVVTPPPPPPPLLEPKARRGRGVKKSGNVHSFE